MSDVVIKSGEKAKRKATRGPAKYGPDFVRDVSTQLLAQYYLDHPELLEKLRKKDDHLSVLRSRAVTLDSQARSWLYALDMVEEDRPDYKPELMFRQWCLNLEPEVSPKDLAKDPDYEKRLRNQQMRHCTDWHWDTNCQKWIDAITRVRTNNLLEV